jgi:cell division protein FtsB
MRKAHRTIGAQLLMIVVVLIGLYFGYSFAREVVQAQRLAGEAEISQQENDLIAAENRKLERDLQYYQSPAYAELRARTDLNMRRPDEQIILPVLPDGAAVPAADLPSASVAPAAPPSAAQPAARAAAVPAPGARNWDRWFSLFTSQPH